jgi:hypothetical protein
MQKEVNSFLDYISWFKLFFQDIQLRKTGRHACQSNVNYDNMRGLRPDPYELFSPCQDKRAIDVMRCIVGSSCLLLAIRTRAL